MKHTKRKREIEQAEPCKRSRGDVYSGSLGPARQTTQAMVQEPEKTPDTAPNNSSESQNQPARGPNGSSSSPSAGVAQVETPGAHVTHDRPLYETSSTELLPRSEPLSHVPLPQAHKPKHEVSKQPLPENTEKVSEVGHNTTPNGTSSELQRSPQSVRAERIPIEDLMGASEWKSRIEDEPIKTKLEHIPGIPEDYVKDFTNWPVVCTTEDVWTLRHLKIPDRHKTYLEFQAVEDILKTTDASYQKFWDTWELLKTRSKELRDKEQAWYRVYKDRDFGGEHNEELTSKGKVILAWNKMVKYQAQPILIDQDGKYRKFSRGLPAATKLSDEPIGGKRGARQLNYGNARLPSKKPRHEGSDTDRLIQIEQDDTPLPLPSNINARDQTHRQEQEEDAGERLACKAENKKAQIEAHTDYSSISKPNKIEKSAQQEALNHGADSERRGYSKEENAKLDYWKRKWSGDKVRLPDHPFPKVEDYTLRADGTYQCFHKDFACADGSCVHGDCCKHGYNIQGLKKAIAKAIRTYKSQVERLILNGDLDKRHKEWKNWCNDTIRKKEKLKEKEAREVQERRQQELQEAAALVVQAQESAIVAPELTVEQVVARDQALKEHIASTLKQHDSWERDARLREGIKKFPMWERFDKWWAASRRRAAQLLLTADEVEILKQDEPSTMTDKDPNFRKKHQALSSVEHTPGEKQPQVKEQIAVGQRQEDGSFDHLFEGPVEQPQEDDSFDPLFDELPTDDGDNGDDPPLDDAELDDYIHYALTADCHVE